MGGCRLPRSGAIHAAALHRHGRRRFPVSGCTCQNPCRSTSVLPLTAITGSIVLAADEPATLARFYGALLDVEPQPGLSSTHWRVCWPAGGWLEVYAPSKSRPQPRQQGRLALCLQRQAEGMGTLALLNLWITTALDLGATVQDPPRQEPFGAEAWLLDPEDNRLLLLVLP